MQYITFRWTTTLLPALVIVLSCFMVACDESDLDRKDYRSAEQKKLHSLVDQFQTEYDSSANDAARYNIEAAYNKKIDSYLKDTLQGSALQFRVKIERLTHVPRNGKTALLFNCRDEHVRYWMEQYFANEDSMKNTRLYKWLSKFKEGTDTIVSFVYTPKAKLTMNGNEPTKIEMIPVPDSFALQYRTSRNE